MLIDLLILFPLISFGALGFRDGSVRKLVSIVVVIITMFLGQFLMHDIGDYLRENLRVQSATAPQMAFFMIFFIMFFLQAVLYKFLTDSYKIGGIVDRVIGSVIGLVQGIIVISVVIFVLTMSGPPGRKTIWDSRLYQPTASVAPGIMDFFSNLFGSAKASIESLTSPDKGKVDSTLKAPQQ